MRGRCFRFDYFGKIDVRNYSISGHKLGDKACSFDEKNRGLKSYISITSNATRTMPSGRTFEFQILGEIDV
jgi:hypothetical protein